MLTVVPVSGRARDSYRLLLRVAEPVDRAGLGHAAAMHMVALPAHSHTGWLTARVQQRPGKWRWVAPCVKMLCKHVYLLCQDPVHTLDDLQVHLLSHLLQ